jgi:hypothetical protein
MSHPRQSLTLAHSPAAAEARRIPGPMAPADLVEIHDSSFPTHFRLLAHDLDGNVRIEMLVEREDMDSVRWFVRVLRHWLAWRHKATRIRLFGS